MQLRCFFLLLFCVFLLSCRKEKPNSIDHSLIDTGSSDKLNDLLVHDSILYACGGLRTERGFVLKSENDVWTNVLSVSGRSIHSLALSAESKLWAGGEFLTLYNSSNGNNWNSCDLGNQVPFHEEDRPIIRKIDFLADTSISFVGGENLGEGIIYRNVQSNSNWNFHFLQHEIRDVEWVDSEHGIIAGHGILAHVNSALEPTTFSGEDFEFYTGIEKNEFGIMVAITQSGKVFFSNNNGYQWQSVETHLIDHFQSIALNDIEYADGKFVVCGNSGLILFSDDGITWREFQLKDELNLYSVCFYNNQCYFTSDNGKIVVTKIN
jgi:hypothetical protein